MAPEEGQYATAAKKDQTIHGDIMRLKLSHLMLNPLFNSHRYVRP